MPYRYKLEALLRLQRSREKQEENRLLACVARLAALDGQLERLQAAGIARKQKTHAEMGNGTLAAVLHAEMAWEEAARSKANEWNAQRQQARTARQEQLERYQAARQRRELLESLKDRQRAVYEAEDARRVQQEMDESYLARLPLSESE